MSSNVYSLLIRSLLSIKNSFQKACEFHLLLHLGQNTRADTLLGTILYEGDCPAKNDTRRTISYHSIQMGDDVRGDSKLIQRRGLSQILTMSHVKRTHKRETQEYRDKLEGKLRQ